MSVARAPAAVLVALTCLPVPVLAQETSEPVCDAPAHAEFDFWIGEWEVRDPEGEVAGHNSIRRVAGGCGLLESWSGARGSVGTSLNMYEPARGAWTQTWVGSGGIVLHLEGGLDGERMVLSGRRVTSEGEVRDRISWTPLDDGRVRQEWDVSRDGGRTWESVFTGLYVPADDGEP